MLRLTKGKEEDILLPLTVIYLKDSFLMENYMEEVDSLLIMEMFMKVNEKMDMQMGLGHLNALMANNTQDNGTKTFVYIVMKIKIRING